MENFAAAILSNSAPDIPADRRQRAHITKFFFLFAINTFGALRGGVRGTRGRARLLARGLWPAGTAEANSIKGLYFSKRRHRKPPWLAPSPAGTSPPRFARGRFEQISKQADTPTSSF